MKKQIPPQDSGVYRDFLNAPTAPQWKRFGLARRAGVSVPLFSVFSAQSAGIGEIPDLELLGRWCRRAGMSIIQLLPMNDTGFNFTPYDAQSTFALEPMYLRLSDLRGAPLQLFKKSLQDLRKRFPAGRKRVDYGIKLAKLELMREIFKKSRAAKEGPEDFEIFCEQNKFWLHDYVLFKILKSLHGEARWEDWPEAFRRRDPEKIRELKTAHAFEARFQEWLQWQLCLQFSRARKSLAKDGVFLMGDLPFLVSRDSADVWAHQEYFKLERLAGAPPDAFFALGQRWGMPPYDWPRIAASGYDYLKGKVRFASCLYDFFRIDHVVGIFRLWTISASEPPGHGGLYGSFDPPAEQDWEGHGKRLLEIMIRQTPMLPCAEDLGVVPECSYKTLREFAIPGMDVQRWTKDWDGTAAFKEPGAYRANSIAVISNHDMSALSAWWEHEAGTVDGELFRRKCAEKGIDFERVRPELFDIARSAHGRLRWRPEIANPQVLAQVLGRGEFEVSDLAGLYRGSYGEREIFWRYIGLSGKLISRADKKFMRAALEKISKTNSIFSVQLLQDWLALGVRPPSDSWNFRINFPGTQGPHNWSLVMPLSLEKMLGLKANEAIARINAAAGRR